MAYKFLERYGEPTMTLEELRTALDERLGEKSLADLIIEDQRTGVDV